MLYLLQVSLKRAWWRCYPITQNIFMNRKNTGKNNWSNFFLCSFQRTYKSTEFSVLHIARSLCVILSILYWIRYVIANVKADTGYGGSYDPRIPAFLWDRPPAFVRHCMDRLSSSELITADHIKELENNFFDVSGSSHLYMFTKISCEYILLCTLTFNDSRNDGGANDHECKNPRVKLPFQVLQHKI